MAAKERNIILQVSIVVAAWLCFFLLPFQFFPYDKSKSPFSSPRFISLFTVSNISLLCFYYLNSRILISRFLALKKIWLYVGIVMASFFAYLTAIYLIMIFSPETQRFFHSEAARSLGYKRPLFFSAGPITLFLIAFVVSTSGRVVRQWFSAEEVKEEVTKQQLETELNLLKTQVNPHFLFNTIKQHLFACRCQ